MKEATCKDVGVAQERTGATCPDCGVVRCDEDGLCIHCGRALVCDDCDNELHRCPGHAGLVIDYGKPQCCACRAQCVDETSGTLGRPLFECDGCSATICGPCGTDAYHLDESIPFACPWCFRDVLDKAAQS